ncbi:helix-turn-helix domain-containing protein [Limosilactobacillus reuteri]|uniref:helix-turn-helix domain-containing protein n=1 Tax=Limosilactobacillus reuteri TaxID=1598 RepID=UPI003D0502F7
MDNISKNIIKYRKLAKLSQEKLAERSEISVGYLSKLERSIIENVSVTVLLPALGPLIYSDYLM